MPESHSKRILLVEDETLIALTERRVLEAAGYAVTVAPNGEQAVTDACGSAPPDLILMDIDLGRGIDGTEAARQILQELSVPIVFLSSHTEPEVVARTEQITSYGHIVKNSGDTVLLASIRMAFQLWDAHQELKQANRENLRSKTYLRTILDADPIGVVVADMDVLNIIDGSTGGPAKNPALQAMRTGTIVEMVNNTILSSRDGTEYQIADTAAPITDENGKEHGSVVVFRDVTEEYRLRMRIEESERLLANVFDAVQAGISVLDADMQVVRENSWIQEKHAQGVPVEGKGKFRDGQVPTSTGPACPAEEARSSGKPHTAQVEIPAADGTPHWSEITAYPMKDERGTVVGIVEYVADITHQKRLEEATTEDRYRLSAILDGTNVGTWEWNVQTGETRFNERWAAMIGYTLDELSPVSIETWVHFVHPEDLERSRKTLRAHFAGETEYYESETRMRHRDGHWISVLDRGKVATWTADGAPEWIFGTHQDISDRVKTRERVQRSQENLRTFFDTSKDFLWVLDATGNIIDVNATVVRRLGYTKKELRKTNVLNLHPEHRRDEAARIIAAMVQGTQDSCSIPIVTKDGYQIPVETSVTPATWSGKDALFGISRDISDLALSEEKYAKMTNSSPVMIGLTDSETGELAEVNDAFCDILGFSRAEAIGNRSTKILGLDGHVPAEMASEMDRTGAVTNLETQLLTKEGHPVDVLLFSTRVQVHDRLLNLTTAIDVRKRKQAEAELHLALSAKQTLMAELNHRVKNNLAMVASLIHLKNSELGDTADLSDLESRVQAIASLHQQLQESARLDRVSLKPYVERIVENAFCSAPTPVEVDLRMEDEEFPTRHATTIGLILNELATNAIKHGLDEMTSLHFTVLHRNEGGRDSLIISNDGKPIPEHVSLDNPTSLGLQLVSALVKQLDGQVRLERVPHPTFTIEYPRPELADAM